jgi:hypothetical protein
MNQWGKRMLRFEKSIEALRSEELKVKYPILSELDLIVTTSSPRRSPSITFHIKTGRIIAVFFYDTVRREFYNIKDDDTFRDVGSIMNSVTNRYIVSNAWWI